MDAVSSVYSFLFLTNTIYEESFMQLKIENISKTYKDGTKALQDIELTLSPGVFGLLGPNGAGKSSLMRTIATLQTPDTGKISLDGTDIAHNREYILKRLGYLPQEFGLYPNLSCEFTLDHFAVLKGISNSKERKSLIDSILQKVDLTEYRKKKVGGFSGGMKQRLGIGIVLLNNPSLIIVDEPTSGLDPIQRNKFNNILCEIEKEIIIIYSTHIVDDVEEACSQMAIMANGRIAEQGNPRELKNRLEGKIWIRHIQKSELSSFTNKYNVLISKLSAGRQTVRVYSEDSLANNGFEKDNPTLEDFYFYTQRKK